MAARRLYQQKVTDTLLKKRPAKAHMPSRVFFIDSVSED
jgi:hypothetical protein